MNLNNLIYTFAFEAQNHPPPTPPVTLYNTRLLASEATILPGAKRVMIKICTEASIIEEGLNEGRKSYIRRKAVYLMGRSVVQCTVILADCAPEALSPRYTSITGRFTCPNIYSGPHPWNFCGLSSAHCTLSISRY